MIWLRKLQRRLYVLLARRKFDAEMDAEMRAHIEMQTQENVSAGMSSKEARYAALRQFGHVDGIKEECREQREGLVPRQLALVAQDLRFAARMMRKNAGSTIIIVLTLGLVIGVCSTLFTAVNYQLFRPLPIEAPEHLVQLRRTNERGEQGALMNAVRFAEYQRRSQSFSGLTALGSQSVTLTGRGEAKHLQAAQVAPNFFEVFGIKPVLGRGFNAREDASSQASTVVINHATWQEVFDQDPEVLGETLLLDQQPYTVIGVMPKDLGRVELAWGKDVWMPWDFTRPTNPDQWFTVVGRLKPGVTVRQTRTELHVLGEAIEGANDPTGAYDRATAAPYLQSSVDADEIMFAIFFILTVVFVLLIGCGNVTNVLIARGLTRRRELAVRLSLGASRGRLVRQLLSEFTALAMVGGLLGLLLAKWTSDLLATYGLEGVPFDVAFDGRVIMFTAGLALFAGLVSGLAPALTFSKPNLTGALKEAGLAASFGRGHHRLRNGLVIGQIAMVLVLLIASGLMIRSFLNLGQADLGYDTQNLATISVHLRDADYPNQGAKRLFIEQAIENLHTVPGVEAVGLTSLGPVARYQGSFPFRIQGWATEGSRSQPRATINSVDATFFELIDARILRGRHLTNADLRSGAGVVVINETLARRYFAGADPIGQSVEMRGHGESRLYRIVGVVADLKNVAFREERFAELFVPYTQSPRFFLGNYFMIRTAADPLTMADPLREAIRCINRDQPVSNVSLIKSQILQLRNWNDEIRYLMVFFGALGFALSMIGLYGVVSCSVTERTREIGVRIAVGAVKHDIHLLICRQSLRLVAIGGAVGASLALASTFVLGNLLYAVSPFDPATYTAVLILVALATVLASLLPARRAANLDPIAALRAD